MATMFETAMNACKICIGTGILVIPFTFQSSGLVFSSFGFCAIAVWNYAAADWLLCCKAQLGIHPKQRQGASTFATIAQKAFGKSGQLILNLLIMCSFLGIMSIYLVIVSQLLLGTGLFGDITQECLVWLTTALLLLCGFIKDLKGLAFASMASVSIIVFGIASIVRYTLSAAPTGNIPVVPLQIWYSSGGLGSLSTFFGTGTFCFGIQIMTLPLQESMTHPQHIRSALASGLGLTAFVYILTGLAVPLSFRRTGRSPQENILLDLPPSSVLTIFIRLSVALCVLVSYPLCLFPLADMVWFYVVKLKCCRGNYQELEVNQDSLNNALIEDAPVLSGVRRIFMMFVLVMMTGVCATMIPFLGLFVSLLGSFSVTLLGFVIPGLAFLKICGARISTLRWSFTVFLVLFGVLNSIVCSSETLIAILKAGRSKL